MAIVYGFLVGLSMVVFVGPVFFTLLKSTLDYGIKAGMAVAFGIIISDIICIVLCWVGASYFEINHTANYKYLSGVGCVVLFGIGFSYLFTKKMDCLVSVGISSLDFAKFFVKGFFVNFLNPFVFFVWLGILGWIKSTYDSEIEQYLYLSAALAGIFTTDTLKVIFAGRIKKYTQPHILIWVYRSFGLILIGFGIRLLWYIFSN